MTIDDAQDEFLEREADAHERSKSYVVWEILDTIREQERDPGDPPSRGGRYWRFDEE